MTSDIERLILGCDEGNPEAWFQLERLLQRKSLSGDFVSMVTIRISKIKEEQKVEERKRWIALGRKAFDSVKGPFAVKEASKEGKRFHLCEGSFSLCGLLLPALHFIFSHDFLRKPICKTCLRLFEQGSWGNSIHAKNWNETWGI